MSNLSLESTVGEDDSPPLSADVTAAEGNVEGDPAGQQSIDGRRSRNWRAILSWWGLTALVVTLTFTAAWLKWQVGIAHETATARTQSVQAAAGGAVAILSYQPDTVDHDLTAARDRLTGPFKESYTTLTHDVVAPGAKQKKVSAVATVPAAASVSATPTHAVVLVFVNQTTIVDSGAPTSTVSSVRVTLDKIADRWLISGFDPV